MMVYIEKRPWMMGCLLKVQEMGCYQGVALGHRLDKFCWKIQLRSKESHGFYFDGI